MAPKKLAMKDVPKNHLVALSWLQGMKEIKEHVDFIHHAIPLKKMIPQIHLFFKRTKNAYHNHSVLTKRIREHA